MPGFLADLLQLAEGVTLGDQPILLPSGLGTPWFGERGGSRLPSRTEGSPKPTKKGETCQRKSSGVTPQPWAKKIRPLRNMTVKTSCWLKRKMTFPKEKGKWESQTVENRFVSSPNCFIFLFFDVDPSSRSLVAEGCKKAKRSLLDITPRRN